MARAATGDLPGRPIGGRAHQSDGERPAEARAPVRRLDVEPLELAGALVLHRPQGDAADGLIGVVVGQPHAPPGWAEGAGQARELGLDGLVAHVDAGVVHEEVEPLAQQAAELGELLGCGRLDDLHWCSLPEWQGAAAIRARKAHIVSPWTGATGHTRPVCRSANALAVD